MTHLTEGASIPSQLSFCQGLSTDAQASHHFCHKLPSVTAFKLLSRLHVKRFETVVELNGVARSHSRAALFSITLTL